MVMVVVAVCEKRVRPLGEEEFVSEERSVGKEEGRSTVVYGGSGRARF